MNTTRKITQCKTFASKNGETTVLRYEGEKLPISYKNVVIDGIAHKYIPAFDITNVFGIPGRYDCLGKTATFVE